MITNARRYVLLALIVAVLTAATMARAQNRTALGVVQQLYALGSAPLSVDKDFTVGTTPVMIHPNDPSDVENIVVDLGTSACTVQHSPSVTTSSGYLLSAAGGSYIEDFRADLTLPTEQLWAVCAASGGAIHVTSLDLQ